MCGNKSTLAKLFFLKILRKPARSGFRERRGLIVLSALLVLAAKIVVYARCNFARACATAVLYGRGVSLSLEVVTCKCGRFAREGIAGTW